MSSEAREIGQEIGELLEELIEAKVFNEVNKTIEQRIDNIDVVELLKDSRLTDIMETLKKTAESISQRLVENGEFNTRLRRMEEIVYSLKK